MIDYDQVNEASFNSYLKNYSRQLKLDINRMCEPYSTSYNDFSLGEWPDSVVAKIIGYPEQKYNWEYFIKVKND